MSNGPIFILASAALLALVLFLIVFLPGFLASYLNPYYTSPGICTANSTNIRLPLSAPVIIYNGIGVEDINSSIMNPYDVSMCGSGFLNYYVRITNHGNAPEYLEDAYLQPRYFRISNITAANSNQIFPYDLAFFDNVTDWQPLGYNVSTFNFVPQYVVPAEASSYFNLSFYVPANNYSANLTINLRFR